jgi:hypothetical protein
MSVRNRWLFHDGINESQRSFDQRFEQATSDFVPALDPGVGSAMAGPRCICSSLEWCLASSCRAEAVSNPISCLGRRRSAPTSLHMLLLQTTGSRRAWRLKVCSRSARALAQQIAGRIFCSDNSQ